MTTCIPCIAQAQRYVGVPGLYGLAGLRGLGAVQYASWEALYENCEKDGGTLHIRSGGPGGRCEWPDGTMVDRSPPPDPKYACHDSGGNIVDGKCVRVFDPGGKAIFEANCRKRGGVLAPFTVGGNPFPGCTMPDGKSFVINSEEISAYPVATSHYDVKRDVVSAVTAFTLPLAYHYGAPKKWKRPGKLGGVAAVVALYFATSFIYGKVAAT